MFMRDISIIVSHMRIFAERSFKSLGLGFPEQAVIMYLMGNSASNQLQIAEYFGIDQGAITKTINKLESKGLVTRKINQNNKREKIISLTPKAISLKDELNKTYQIWSKTVFKNISEKDQEILEKTISKMAENSIALLNKDN